MFLTQDVSQGSCIFMYVMTEKIRLSKLVLKSILYINAIYLSVIVLMKIGEIIT